MKPLTDNDPKQIGIYRLLGVLGMGGMGTVYLAVTPEARLVALKVMHEHYARQPEFRKRFQREVEAAKKVGGRFTAQVLDSSSDFPPRIVTKYIAGGLTLMEIIAQRGPLNENTVRILAAGLVEALQSIHDAGIVHRDLKPSNIMIGVGGLHVIDFGIAARIDGTRMTHSHQRPGTAGYTAPEYLEKGKVVTAGDIFALGAVLYFAATGRDAFTGDTYFAKAWAVVTQQPNLDGAPPSLRPLIERCLSKNPSDRPTLEEIQRVVQMPATQAEGTDWLPDNVVTAVKTLAVNSQTALRALARGVAQVGEPTHQYQPVAPTRKVPTPAPTKPYEEQDQQPGPDNPPVFVPRSRGGVSQPFHPVPRIKPGEPDPPKRERADNAPPRRPPAVDDWPRPKFNREPGTPPGPEIPARKPRPAPRQAPQPEPVAYRPEEKTQGPWGALAVMAALVAVIVAAVFLNDHWPDFLTRTEDQRPAYEQPVFLPKFVPASKLGTSKSEDGQTWAKITRVTTADKLYSLEIRFEGVGIGPNYLQRGCIHVRSGKMHLVEAEYEVKFTDLGNNRFSAIAKYPLVHPGNYTFEYTCQGLSEVPIGRNAANVQGVSVDGISGVSVLGVQHMGSDLVLDVAGSTDMGPDGQILTPSGNIVTGDIDYIGYIVNSKQPHLARHWVARMTFRGASQGMYKYYTNYSDVKVS